MTEPQDSAEVAAERARAGLCANCAHARVIENDRGSRFYLCDLARTDRRFPRYPRLPVTACIGWQARGADASTTP
jgi:hypothetical protein